MPTLERIDTGNDAAIAEAIAAFEAEGAQQKAEKTEKRQEAAEAKGDGNNKAKIEEAAAPPAAPLATDNGDEEPKKPSTTAATFPTATKRTFSADDCSNDEALAWALHEAELPSNKGPSAFARAAAEASKGWKETSTSSSPCSSSSSPPPSPPSAAALAASAPLADWRALLERAASERLSGERFAPLVPRPLHSSASAVAAPWPWSGLGSSVLGGGGTENRERARLAATLSRLGLVERAVRGDGACQFRALSDQLYGSEDYHEAVRGLAVQTLAAHPERYAPFICGNGNGNSNSDPNLFTSYVARMSNPKEWGDHVTLQAAADGLGLRIVVVSSFETEPLIEIEPAEKRSARVLFVAFWHEIHYGSVYVAPPSTFPSTAGRPVVSALPVTMAEAAAGGGGSVVVVAEGGFGQPGPAAAAVGAAAAAGKKTSSSPSTTPERIKRWFKERLA